MQSKFVAAVNQLCAEKNLPREIVLDAIKDALVAAYKKDYGQKEQEIEVLLDEGNENITVLKILEVASKIEDENIQISKKDALKYKKTAKVGDKIKIDVTPGEYGRIAAQTAKQVIIQKLQEAEKNMVFDKFKQKEGEIFSALVSRVERGQVFLDFDKITAILPPRGQVKSERYYPGQRIKIYLDKVVMSHLGPELYISRTHPELVEKLFEMEIPEIKADVVKIKAVAREPGVRSKIAVESTQEDVDPVGACVGQKGMRIQSIMDELGGEHIDIIEWSEEIEKLVTQALSPAKISKIEVIEDEKRIKAHILESERALAIGRGGQNVRLAGILCGYEIDIVTVEHVDAIKPKKDLEKKDQLTPIKEGLKIDQEIIEKLEGAGIEFVEQLSGLNKNYLLEIEGITEEEADKILDII